LTDRPGPGCEGLRLLGGTDGGNIPVPLQQAHRAFERRQGRLGSPGPRRPAYLVRDPVRATRTTARGGPTALGRGRPRPPGRWAPAASPGPCLRVRGLRDAARGPATTPARA